MKPRSKNLRKFPKLKSYFNLFKFIQVYIMAHFFNPELVKYLSVEFGSTEEKLCAVINNFRPEAISSKKIEKQNIPQRDGSINSSIPSKKTLAAVTKKTSKTGVIKHACERIPKGKSDPCGKPSKRTLMIGDVERWYCGTEKSGCFKPSLAESKKLTNVTNEEKIKKKKTEKVSLSASEVKAKVLKPKEPLQFRPLKLDNGKTVVFNKTYKYLLNKDTNEVYGKLTKTQDVDALTKDDEAILESYDVAFSQTNKNNVSSESNSSESESESLKESESESEESESEDLEIDD